MSQLNILATVLAILNLRKNFYQDNIYPVFPFKLSHNQLAIVLLWQPAMNKKINLLLEPLWIEEHSKTQVECTINV